MGIDHYENFPVASVLLPARLRRPVTAIYRFARTADDVADEGDAPAHARLRDLATLRAGIEAIEAARPSTDPLFAELETAIREHALPTRPFHDLLDAFAQDVVKTRYADFPELLDYCRRSANPVGRLMLHLYRCTDEASLARSDAICTALQLANFWQDVAIDFAKGRIYIPLEDLRRFGVGEDCIARGSASAAYGALMRHEIARTREMLHAGAALGRVLRGRVGLELRMIVAGGDAILQKLLAVDGDVFRRRPVLRSGDWLGMLFRALTGDGRIAA